MGNLQMLLEIGLFKSEKKKEKRKEIKIALSLGYPMQFLFLQQKM